MDQGFTADVVEADRQARKNTRLLALAQAVGGGVAPINITLGGLTGAYLLGPDKSLATLPVSTYLIGVAVGAIPAAMLMRRVGRRLGFIGGALIGIVAGILGGSSVLADSFLGFAVSMGIAGFSMAFVQQYRFAAADAGSPVFRARAISWVLAGGVVAAVIGPQTAIFTRDLLAPVPFAGAFFGMSVLALASLIVLLFLGGTAAQRPSVTAASGGRPLIEIAAQPRFAVAVICGIGAYALMSLLMTAAPLAMIANDHSHNNTALGIQWHVLAMFAPSFVTGALIARFGQELVIGAGFVLLAVCAAIALAGVDLMNFWVALILLGVGWNFGFIGSTAMLTETYRPEEKSRVQGANDFLLFGSVAMASLLSGRLFATVGWNWINLVAFPVIAICLAALAFAALGRRRQPA